MDIEERKENIINQYRAYLGELSRPHLIEKLTINESDKGLIEAIMEKDQMGEQDGLFEPS